MLGPLPISGPEDKARTVVVTSNKGAATCQGSHRGRCFIFYSPPPTIYSYTGGAGAGKSGDIGEKVADALSPTAGVLSSTSCRFSKSLRDKKRSEESFESIIYEIEIS